MTTNPWQWGKKTSTKICNPINKYLMLTGHISIESWTGSTSLNRPDCTAATLTPGKHHQAKRNQSRRVALQIVRTSGCRCANGAEYRDLAQSLIRFLSVYTCQVAARPTDRRRSGGRGSCWERVGGRGLSWRINAVMCWNRGSNPARTLKKKKG